MEIHDDVPPTYESALAERRRPSNRNLQTSLPQHASCPGPNNSHSQSPNSDSPPSPPYSPRASHENHAPPGYLTIDTQPASFVLSLLFIYTFYPSPPHIGDATYQLSADLSTYSRELRIRRLPAPDSRRVAAFAASAQRAEALRFEKGMELYSLRRVFGKSRALEMVSRKKGGLPGTILMDWDFRKWRCWQVVQREEMGVKVGEDKRLLFCVKVKWREVRKARYWEWRNGEGDVLAVETRERVGDGDGGGEEKWMVQLNEGKLESVMRDALVACWVARVWFFASAPLSVGEMMRKWRQRLYAGMDMRRQSGF